MIRMSKKRLNKILALCRKLDIAIVGNAESMTEEYFRIIQKKVISKLIEKHTKPDYMRIAKELGLSKQRFYTLLDDYELR